MRHSVFKIMFSITLLLIGVILLLVNLGVISLEINELFVVGYPFLLLLYGLLSLFQIFIKKKEHYFFTLFIIIFSSLLILDRFQLLEFRFLDFWKLWPLIIILIALGLLKPGKFTIEFERDNHVEQEQKKSKSLRFGLGDVKYDTENWPVESMKIVHVIGDVYIDISKGYIPEREIEIKIHARIGDIKIITPDDLAVSITAEAQIGEVRLLDSFKDGIGNSLEFQSPNYEESVKKVRLYLYTNIGDIVVQNV